MKTRSIAIAVVAAALAAAVPQLGCNTAPKEPADQATLASASNAALDGFKNADPSLSDLLDKAVGYAVFPDVGKAGFIAGGSYGKGEVFENGKKIGYADITQATGGLQVGAQTFDELILFLRPQELSDFKSNEVKFAGNVSAVVVKSGAAATSDTSKGVIVFVRSKGGMMAEASVGGQRFRFQPLNASASATK